MDKDWFNLQINNLLAKKYTSPMAVEDRLKGGASVLPIIGDAISGYDAYQAARRGDYTGAMLSAVGLLPFIPGITKPVGENMGLKAVIRNTLPVPSGGINSPLMRQDVAPLAQWFDRLLSNAKIPHETVHSGSNYGPSSYIKIHGLNKEVRISNHDKGVFNSQIYTQPRNVEDFINVMTIAREANPIRPPEYLDKILAEQKLEEIRKMYPMRLKSADKKLSKGKSLTKSEQEALDWRSSGGKYP